WGKLLDSQWRDNPYNRVNGGPLDDPAAFLTDPTARTGARNYVRYVAARYGAYSTLFGWVLWNEVDTVSDDMTAIAAWHRDIIGVLRTSDVAEHIVSTEFRKFGDAQVWDIPGIDYTQVEAYADSKYSHGEGLIGRFDERQTKLAAFGKPIVIEEYGGAWWG